MSSISKFIERKLRLKINQGHRLIYVPMGAFRRQLFYLLHRPLYRLLRYRKGSSYDRHAQEFHIFIQRNLAFPSNQRASLSRDRMRCPRSWINQQFVNSTSMALVCDSAHGLLCEYIVAVARPCCNN